MSRKRSARRWSTLTFCADALLLSLMLAGAGLCCQSAYPLGENWGLLTLTAAVLGVMLAAVHNLPRFRWAGLVLVAEGYALCAWLLWDKLALGARTAAASLSMVLGGSLDLPVPFPEGERDLFLCAALALLALPLSWAALRLRSALAVAAMTYPLLLPAFLADQLPAWPCFLLLLTAWCVLALTGAFSRKDGAARARLTLAALPAAGCALVLLTLALPRERYVYPTWSEQVQLALRSGELPSALPDLLGSGPRLGGSSSRVDLAGAGPMSLSSRTMLRVETDVAGRLYLRGISAGTYTGTAWEPLDDAAYEGLGDLGGYEPLNFPALTAPGKDWHAVTVDLTGAPGNCLYVPYSLLTDADELAGGGFVDDSHIQKGFGVGSYTLYYRPEAGPDVTMRPLEGAAAQAEEAYRTFVYQHYLEVPEEAGRAVIAWVERINARRVSADLDESYRSETLRTYWSQLGAAETVRVYLAATTTYDTAVPAMPAGADFVDYFLNQSGRGYCMHYATAAALFLRMAGIPARYVSGYVVTVPSSGKVNVPESAAHAWVEIYLDGYGWYPVEVTPTYGVEEAEPEETAEPEATPAPTPTPTPTPTPQSSAAPTPGVSQAPAEGPAGTEEGPARTVDLTFLRWPAAVLGLWLLLLLRRRLTARLWRRRLWTGGANAAVLWAYRLQKRLLPWGGREDPAVEELALKARFSQHTLTEAERKRAAEAVEAERDRVDAALPLWKRLVFRWLFALR